MSANEYIDQENYAEGYNKSVESLKNNPEVLELDKLCYEVFMGNEPGKKLLAEFERRFIIPALAHPNNQMYKTQCVFFEGFKEAFRMIKGSITAHEQRIEAEKDKK